MKYYLVAGEASGDLHGANLMKELKKLDPQAEFRFFGGDLMQAEGDILVKHFAEMAFMGFFEVAVNLRTILKNLAFCNHFRRLDRIFGSQGCLECFPVG